MPVAQEDVVTAYRLFLGRAPTPAAVEKIQQTVADLSGLRRHLMSAPEFQVQLRHHRVDAWPQPDALVHLHVPRTGGTSLNTILSRNVAEDEILSLGLHEIDELTALPPRDRQQKKLLFGHLEHGVARHLPQHSIYIALLRDPAARLFSIYGFLQHDPSGPLAAAAPGFGGFLRAALDDPDLRLEVDNGQTRRLAGQMHKPIVDYRSMFAMAMRNLVMPDMIIGTTERFEVLLYTLWSRGLIADAEDSFTPDADTGPACQAAIEGLDEAERGLLDSYCYWDRLLHRAAELLVDGTQCDIPDAPEVA